MNNPHATVSLVFTAGNVNVFHTAEVSVCLLKVTPHTGMVESTPPLVRVLRCIWHAARYLVRVCVCVCVRARKCVSLWEQGPTVLAYTVWPGAFV